MYIVYIVCTWLCLKVGCCQGNTITVALCVFQTVPISVIKPRQPYIFCYRVIFVIREGDIIKIWNICAYGVCIASIFIYITTQVYVYWLSFCHTYMQVFCFVVDLRLKPIRFVKGDTSIHRFHVSYDVSCNCFYRSWREAEVCIAWLN